MEENKPAVEETAKVDKTYTQEEVNEVVQERFARERKKAEESIKNAVKKKTVAIREAEKLKNLSTEDRYKAQLDSYKKKIIDLEQKELRNQFKLELSNRGIPTEIADTLPINDAKQADAVLQILESMKSNYDKELQDLKVQANKSNLRGIAPKSTSSKNNAVLKGGDNLLSWFNSKKKNL